MVQYISGSHTYLHQSHKIRGMDLDIVAEYMFVDLDNLYSEHTPVCTPVAVQWNFLSKSKLDYR